MSVATGRTSGHDPRAHTPARRSLDPVLTALAAVTVIALVWRLSQIDQSLVGDEGYTFQDVSAGSLSSTISLVNAGGENSPPLFFIFAWFTAKIGDPSVWLRLPSIVLGTATVPLVYATAREVFSRAAGLAAAAIAALSPFAIFYSVEGRAYATMAFFVALSTFAVLRAVRTRSMWWWALYGVAVAGAAYSHYTAIFLLAAQAAWTLWICRRELRLPILAHGLALLLYVPWLPHIRGKALGTFNGLYPLSVHRVATDAVRPVIGFPNGSLSGIPSAFGLAAVAVCCAIGLAAVVRSRVDPPAWPAAPSAPEEAQDTEPGRDRTASIVLLVLLALATPIGVLLYSLIDVDIWFPRGIYASAPAQIVVLGGLLTAPRGAVRVACVTVVLVTLLVGSIRSLGASYARPPFRALAHYIDDQARPGDPVVYASIVTHLVVPAMFRRPHLQYGSISEAVTANRLRRPVFVILDDTIARLPGAGLTLSPHLSGYRLVHREHYAGQVPTDVLTYRAA